MTTSKNTPRALQSYRSRSAAYRRAAEVSTSPRVALLDLGGYVAIGDTMLAADGTRDELYYGAYGTSCSRREYREWWDARRDEVSL